jgi:hypothetical protein
MELKCRGERAEGRRDEKEIIHNKAKEKLEVTNTKMKNM